jgi:hypothetical protein
MNLISEDYEAYCTAKQAAAIMSRNSGRAVRSDYLRVLARRNKIEAVKVGNQNMYLRLSVAAYVVAPRAKRKDVVA